MALPSLDDYFPDWKEREALAEAMIPIIGKLYRKNVVVYCYGRALHNQSVTQIMKAHRYVRQVAQNELSEFESFPILEALADLDLGPSHIDVGKLATAYMEASEGNGLKPEEFVAEQCAEIIGRHTPKPTAKQIFTLHNLADDNPEVTNYANDRPEMAHRLQALYATWQKDVFAVSGE